MYENLINSLFINYCLIPSPCFVCHTGYRYVFLCLQWNILHCAATLQHQRPSVWVAESLLLVCLAATSARLSHTHADASWLPWGYVIITSNQIPECFNLDYVREVVTESCQEVNTVCLICLLQVCQRMVAHWGISAGTIYILLQWLTGIIRQMDIVSNMT